MKRFFSIILALLFTITSCKDDFLTKIPVSNVNVENFYKTEADFRQAIIGIYAPLRNLYGIGVANRGAWTLGEMRSDNTCFIFNTKNRGDAALELVETFLDDATNEAVNTKYVNDYVIINRANTVLAKLSVASIDNTAGAKFKGEALFLRAFAYFDLVQYFGDVPLITTPASTYDQTQVARSPKDQIYAQILKDAAESATLLPPPDKQEKGHVANGAAYTLLGNVNVVLKKWSEAESNLKNVKGYTLLSDYASIYDPLNKNNSESIFEAQYWDDPSAGLSSVFAYDFLPVLSNPGVIAGFPSGSSNFRGGWNIPTPDLLSAYENGDKRKNASIGFYTGEGYTSQPYVKKYVHGANIEFSTNDDWPIYRYAETLLLLAEALNEQGKSSESLEYLNRVHANMRTGLSPVITGDQAGLRSAILHERQIELAFENKRWPDLLRTGTAISIMNAQGAKIKSNPQAYYYPAGVNPPPAAYNVTQERLLFPLPTRELQANPKLLQNPGY